MNSAAFDALTRHAGSAQDRRASLKALGAAGLGAALAAPLAADAKNNKNKKKCKKKTRKKCNGQIEGCQNTTEAFCAGQGMGEQDCLDALLPCCDLFQDCNASAAVDCIYDAFTVPNGT